jgi:hypothetical protein
MHPNNAKKKKAKNKEYYWRLLSVPTSCEQLYTPRGRCFPVSRSANSTFFKNS